MHFEKFVIEGFLILLTGSKCGLEAIEILFVHPKEVGNDSNQSADSRDKPADNSDLGGVHVSPLQLEVHW